MGAFDDLIPQDKRPAGGAFDDLIPADKPEGAGAGQTAKALVGAVNQGGRSVARLVTDLSQAPIDTVNETLANIPAAADRLLTKGLNAITPAAAGRWRESETLQNVGRVMSGVAQETRERNLKQDDESGSAWLNPRTAAARVGKGLEERMRQDAEKDAAIMAAETPDVTRAAKAISDAQGFTGTAKAIFDNPSGMVPALGESLPSMALGVAGAGRSAAATMRAAAVDAERAALRVANAGGDAAAQQAARETVLKAGQELATKRAGAVGAGTEGATAASQGGNQAFEQVMAMPLEQLANSPRFMELQAQLGSPEAARERLANEVRGQSKGLTALATVGGSALVSKIAGGDKTARLLSGAERSQFSDIPKNMLQEGAEEVVQGVGQDLAEYGAMTQADPNKDLDLGGSAAQNFAAGAAMGGPGTAGKVLWDRRPGADARAPAAEPAATPPAAPQPAPAPAATPTPAAAPAAQQSDPLAADAATLVTSMGKASLPAIQRHFRIGYNRAAGLLAQLERDGIVSPPDEQGGRTVLAKAPTATPIEPTDAQAPEAAGTPEPQTPADQAGTPTGLDAAAGTPDNEVDAGAGSTPVEAAGLTPADDGVPESRDPSGVQASWVIKNKETGEVILETFDREKVKALNKAKYEAVPILEHLQSLNGKPKPAPAPAPTTGTNANGQDVNLQNRNRGSAASVAQMTAIARDPDYLRLGPSRTPDSGAPMVFAVGNDLNRIAVDAYGREDVAVMSDGQRVPFRYAVADASTLEPSHFADGRTNPAFSQDVNGTLKALNNGRTAGLRAAHEMGTAGPYLEALRADAGQHGVDPAVIDRTPNPVLVRVYDEASNTKGMAAKSQGQGEALSVTEQAATDAPLIDLGLLGQYRGGGLDLAQNAGFVRGFVQRLQDAGQPIGKMMSSDGGLSADGLTRLKAAMMQVAYGDPALVESMFESMDANIKAIGGALREVAGEWAVMRAKAADGTIPPDVDVTGNLMQALRLVQDARQKGQALYDMARQTDMMTGETPDELTVRLLGLFFSGQFFTRPAAQSTIQQRLGRYIEASSVASAEPDMFGEVVGRDDILNTLLGRDTLEADPTPEPAPAPESQGQPDSGSPVGSPPAADRQRGGGRKPKGTGTKPAADRQGQPGGQDGQVPTGNQEGGQGAGTQARPEVAPNTIFTEDAAAAARERLKKKLANKSQAGTKGQRGALDPEEFADGVTLAGYHIEKGARTFAAYARAMLADLGEAVMPYLKSWYMGVKYDPRSQGLTGMDSAADVDAVSVESLTQYLQENQDDDQRPDANAPEAGQDGERPQPEAPAGDAGAGAPAGDGPDVEADGGQGGRRAGGQRRNRPGAAADGERGDQQDGAADGRPGPAGDAARGDDAAGAGPADGGRPDAEPEADRAGAEPGGQPAQKLTLAERLAAQAAAASIPVKPGIENIRATLPLLLEGQQNDVLFAETRFAKPDGYGVLFTNGTGTGKTYSGLGIVKRMHMQGKRNGLIVVPSEKIANDWMAAGKNLGLSITALADTSDAGKGIVVTTYANLGANDAVMRRDMDFVLADEAQQLMQSADAATTGALDAVRALTLHPTSAIERYNRLNREDIAKLAAMNEQYEAWSKLRNRDDTMDVMRDSLAADMAKLEAQMNPLRDKLAKKRAEQQELVKDRQGAARPRAVFLSATPFAYEVNVQWAAGYLFEYPEVKDTGRYNQPSPYQAFMVQHFGYSMRTGKLNKPSADVDSDLMQRNFNTFLRKSGVLSSRMLDVDFDYERRFILIKEGIGQKIDEGMKWLREADNGRYWKLYDQINAQFDSLTRRRLLEAIKAREAVPFIKAQHDLGRKVVVFYDFNTGGGINLFNVQELLAQVLAAEAKNTDPALATIKVPKRGQPQTMGKVEEEEVPFSQLLREFIELRPDLQAIDFRGYTSPLDTLRTAFPGAGVYNGMPEFKKSRLQAIDNFNDDAQPGANLLLVQKNANAGWSGHDTTGKHQRVLINLGLPTEPTVSIQQEGRTYRVGQASDAIFHYFNTGTTWERIAFASTISRRAGTAENLAMGEEARGLREAYIQGFEDSDPDYKPSAADGKGGKAKDRSLVKALTDWDRARALYFAKQKRNSSNKAQEGTDFFATPEPVGLKMVEWADIRHGEALLEPSAGDGAIARWFPEKQERTVVEPSLELGSRLALATDAKLVATRFEDFNTVNKFDVIVMNPPFGLGGKTSTEHLAKAIKHLNDGGRIVALLPDGPAANKRLDALLTGSSDVPAKPVGTFKVNGKDVAIYEGDTVSGLIAGSPAEGLVTRAEGNILFVKRPGATTANGMPYQAIREVKPTGSRTRSVPNAPHVYEVARISLPMGAFERAGTDVKTHIVILDKTLDPQKAAAMGQSTRDLSDVKTVKDLFDRLESMELPKRQKAAPAAPPAMGQAPKPAPAARAEAVEREQASGFTPAEQGAATFNLVGNKIETDAPMATTETKAGKKLQGVFVPDGAMAKVADKFTWRAQGGGGQWFVRMEHVVRPGASGAQSVNEPGATYQVDLFGEPLDLIGQAVPAATKRAGAGRPAQPASAGDMDAAGAVPGDTPMPAGEFLVNTLVGVERTHQLSARKVESSRDLAQAMRHLYRSAVERFDALVTDKSGKPLAIVGGFKGAISSASVQIDTLVGEAVRVPNAANIWFAHNHPSGRADLSNADRRLYERLQGVFTGSGIEPQGLIAVSRNAYSFTNAFTNDDDVMPPAGEPMNVPGIERVLDDRRDFSQSPKADSPPAALQLGRQLWAKGGNGVMLLDAQMRMAGWTPLPESVDKLRDTGGLNTLYRALSQSNASSAILVHDGVLDQKISNTGVSTGQNVAAALQLAGVNVVDSLNVKSGMSQASIGRDIADGPVFSRAAGGSTPAFKKWFGDSKVVDAAGAPRVMYHGTAQDITAFRPQQANAIFVTDDPEFAAEFAASSEFKMLTKADEWGEPQSSQNILPVYVKAENPFDYENPAHRKAVADALLAAKGRVRPDGEMALARSDGSPTLYTAPVIEATMARGDWNFIERADVQAIIRSQGHDGFYVEEGGRKNLGVYEPAQLKSAVGNRGAFDGSNPDLRASRGAGRSGVGMQQLQALRDRVRKAMPSAPEIVLHDSPSEAEIGLRLAIQQAGAFNDVEGALYQGRIYLFGRNLASLDRAEFVLAEHEVAHAGLRAVLGDNLARAMNTVAEMNPALRKLAEQKVKTQGLRMAIAMEEVLVDIPSAELPKLKGWRGLVKMMADGLDRMGLTRAAAVLRNWLEGKTDAADLAEALAGDLIRAARDHARAKPNAQARGQMAAQRLEATAGRAEWMDKEARGRGFKDAAAMLATKPEVHAKLQDLWSRQNPGVFSREDRPRWYSALTREVGKVGMNAAPAKGWADTIKGMVQKGQVKQDEIEWTGLGDWLALQEGKVSKEQVLEFLDGNGVQVQEVTLSDVQARALPPGWEIVSDEDGMYAVLDEDGEVMGEGETRQEALEDAQDEDALPDSAGAPKYGQYTLPGGENYREVLLTLPTKDAGKLARANELNRLAGVAGTPGAERVRLLQERDRLRDEAGNGQQFKSGHWDQPNILAHIRVNDRTDADGKRVLFVEEIQSDWGQSFKKQRDSEAAIEARTDAILSELGGPIGRTDAEGWHFRWMGEKVAANGAKSYDEAKAQQRAKAERMARERMGSGTTPAAPFVTKTEGWLNLALKRVMTMAVEGGYDRVAFVTGEQSAERYDLSKQVDQLVAYEDNTLVARQGGRNVIERKFKDEAELADMIGKEAARKLLEARPDMNNQRVLSGQDLKVGGEGMKAFYDAIVPNAAKGLLKKVGGGQVGAVDLKLTGMPWSEYEKYAVDHPYRKKNAPRVPGFDITPAMRDKLAAGLPLFSRAPKPRMTRADTQTQGFDFDAPAPEDFALTAPTRQDVLAQQQAREDETKREAAQRRAAEELARKDAERKAIAARMDASAENFQLGQSAEDALSGQGGLFSRAPTVEERADTIIGQKAARKQRLDKALQTLTRLSGIEFVAGQVYDTGAYLLNRFTPGFVKAGVISDYGLADAIKDRRSALAGRQRNQIRDVGKMVQMLSTLTREESRVAYEWLNGDNQSTAEEMLQALPESSVKVLEQVRELIDTMSQEAMRLKQLTPDAFERNRFAYLHRSYAKHELAQTTEEKRQRAAGVKIVGDQYKGRGITKEAGMAQIKNGAPEWWGRRLEQGKADTSLKGQKFTRLEKRVRAPARGAKSTMVDSGTQQMDGFDAPGSKTRIAEVVYIPMGQPIPAKFSEWDNAGLFEVRDVTGEKVEMWRDFTYEERQAMGELDEVRYAIVNTMHGMIHDIEVGKYLEWLAQNYAEKSADDVPGELVPDNEASFAGRAKPLQPGQWVRVPETKIPGTQVLKYGTLAGRYVEGPVWNEIRQVTEGNFTLGGPTWNKLLGLWKLSKTALSPGVHTNNIMANMVMADWHNVQPGHVAKALRVLLAASEQDGKGVMGKAGRGLEKVGAIKDTDAAREILNRYRDSGGDVGMWATNELAQDQLTPLLEELEAEVRNSRVPGAGQQVGVMAALQLALQRKLPESFEALKASKPVKATGNEAQKLIDLYQAEDDVFRLAAWLRAKEEGQTDMEAGDAARTSFLDYQINAPWIQAMRSTAWPFISFTYRGLPMLLETAGKKPHKLMKLMLLAGAVNAMGTMIAGGGDEEEERVRRMLPDEKAGKVWGIVPKLIRMPWNDANGNPVFLDIRRWIPLGDIADVGQGNAAFGVPPSLMPGGPLAIFGELWANKSAFTGQPITLESDSGSEKASKVFAHLYRSAMPNFPGLPGTYATDGIANAAKGKTDVFGREGSVPQAFASALGVKVAGYAPDVLEANLTMKVKKEADEVMAEVRRAARQEARKGITAEEYKDIEAKQVKKLDALMDEYRAKTERER